MSRGMIKWAPFQSLKEQTIYLHEIENNRKKVPKPILSEDQISEINYSLTTYNNEVVVIVYYKNGFIKQIKGRIKKIDPTFKYLLVEDIKISFNNLLDIIFI
jgi:hypothetical protein